MPGHIGPTGLSLPPATPANPALSTVPVVGRGLTGLPRRAPKSPEVDYIIFYMASGGIKVYTPTWTDVTTSYITSQPNVGPAGSSEQMWMPIRQKKYLGIGSYQLSGYSAGAVVDMSTKPWTAYENYTVISNDGGGNSSVRMMAPLPNGYAGGFTMSSTNDKAIVNIATKAETGGQPTGFTSGTSPGCMKVYGSYLYYLKGDGIFKFSADGAGTLTTEASYGSIAAGGTCSLAVKSDGTRVYAVNNATLYVLTSTLSLVTTVDLSSYIGYSEAMEISWDDKWLLLGCQKTSSNGVVLVINTDTLAISQMTVVSSGTTNSRFVGCAWYPDNNQYIVCGYVEGKSHVGKRTAGGWTKNLWADVFGSTNSQFGVAIVPK